MAKEFKKHMMYSPDGKSAEVNTREDHLRYKELGWSHNPKTTPINQVSGYNSPLTQVDTKTPTGTNWYKQSYQAAMGGGGLGSGYEGTGYTVDWSGIDFGKADLQKKMNSNESDPGGKKKRCARKGGVWNEETGRCDKKGKEKKGEDTVECPGAKEDPPTHKVVNGVCEKIDYHKNYKEEESDCNCDNPPTNEEDPCYAECNKGKKSEKKSDEKGKECEEEERGKKGCEHLVPEGTGSTTPFPASLQDKKYNPETGECDCKQAEDWLDKNQPGKKKTQLRKKEYKDCVDDPNGEWNDECQCCNKGGVDCCPDKKSVDGPDGPVKPPVVKPPDVPPVEPKKVETPDGPGGTGGTGEPKTVNFADLGGGGGNYNQYDLFNDKSIETGTTMEGLNSFSQGENRTEYGTWSGGTITKTDGGVKESGTLTKKLKNTTLPLQSSTEWSEDEASGLLKQTKVNQRHNKFFQKRLSKSGELDKNTLKFNQEQLKNKEAGNSYIQYKVVEAKNGKKIVIKEHVKVTTKQADEWKEVGKVKTEAYKKNKKILSGKHDGEMEVLGDMKPYFLIDGKKVWQGSQDYEDLLAKAKEYNKKNLSRSNYFPFSGDSNPAAKYSSPMKHPAEDSNLKGYKEGLRHAHNEDGSWKWVADGAPDDAKPHRNTPSNPFGFKSPFARRDRSHLKVRDNWMPTGSPMNYGSPFHQEQPNPQDPSTPPQQGGTIWDKIKSYGSDMPERIDKFIQHANYSPETDKPINAFQNQQWVGVITEWLQGQKQSMVEATNNKDKETQQKISSSVNQLIQDVTTYSGKFLDWIARNSGDQAEGNAGGSVVSKGSKKDERFIGDITFMGDQNTVVAIGEDGKLGIKSYGLEKIKYVEDLDDGVFAKDDAGYAMFLEASGQLQKDAEAGKPLNEDIVNGHSDLLLKNKDSVLSWAFDPLYGQAWIQDFAKGNSNASFDVFMPESPEFDIDYLTDEIHGWLGNKLTEAYNKNVPQQPEQKGDAAQGIMDETLAGVEEEKKNKKGVYAESGEQPQQPAPEEAMAQGPPPQGTPMAFDGGMTRSQQLLKRILRNKI